MSSTVLTLGELGRTGNGVFVVDENQRILTWNKGMEQLLGFSASKVLGRCCYQVIQGRLRSGKPWCCRDCRVQRCVRRGILLHDFNIRAARKAGGPIWVNTSIVELRRRNKPLTLHVMRRLYRSERRQEALTHILRTLRAYGLAREVREDGGEGAAGRLGAAVPVRALAMFTRREIEVLTLVAHGHSNREIAMRLGISQFTVRAHVRSLLRKAGLHSKVQVASFAIRNGLF